MAQLNPNDYLLIAGGRLANRSDGLYQRRSDNAMVLVSNGAVIGTWATDGAGDVELDGDLSVTGASDLVGNVGFNGDLEVTGDLTVGGTAAVTGAVTASDAVGVTGNLTVGGTAGVTGAVTASDALNVTGKITGSDDLQVSGDIDAGSIDIPSTLPKCLFFDDFIDLEGIAKRFTAFTTETGGTPVNGVVTGSSGGVHKIGFDSADEEQVSGIALNDDIVAAVTKGPVLEFRALISATLDANDILVMGLASAQNNAEDSVAAHAWFRVEGANLDLLLESDDGSNDNDDKDSTIDLSGNTWYEFKIDLSDTSDVKFYYRAALDAAWTECTDGATTFDISNYSDGLQPLFQIHKSGGTHQTYVLIDYVRLTWNRVAA